MDRTELHNVREEQKAESSDPPQTTSDDITTATSEVTTAETPVSSAATSPKSKASKKSKKNKKNKKAKDDASDDEAAAADKSGSDSSDSDSDSESEEEVKRKSSKKGSKKVKAKVKPTKKGKRKSKKAESSSDSDSSDSSSDSESEESDSSSSSSSSSSSEEEAKRKSKKKSKKRKQKQKRSRDEYSSSSEYDSEEEATPAVEDPVADATALTPEQLEQVGRVVLTAFQTVSAPVPAKASRRSKKSKKEKKAKQLKRGTLSEFKRVNHVWDNNQHMWKLSEEVDEHVEEFDEYAFLVKKHHDWDGHYTRTSVVIKSKLLKEALTEVMKDVQGETLEATEPSIEPNMLFNFLEEMRVHYKKTLKSKLKKEKKKKVKKTIEKQIKHVKLLVKYIDEDYEETKKTLYPMLELGNITFDLLWALFKPNTIAYTSTYGDHENPRCFKVDRATHEQSFIKGEWYSLEGRYMEYDGKNFGLGDFESTVEQFKGSRKITSLGTYPLKYHKESEKIRTQLIERGKLFVTMTGQNYRGFKGLAFQKKRKAIAKFNINGRVIIDPALFRRINANYPISVIKPKEVDSDDEDSDDEGCGCGDESEDDNLVETIGKIKSKNVDHEDKERTVTKYFKDKKGRWHFVKVAVDEDGKEIRPENLEKLASASEKRSFFEDELLIASPVVLGFAFQEKTWLEFSLSAIAPIEWNTDAYNSLVLPPNQKHVVKALVSAHKFHGSQTIDDVVQGKGKGLVFVLHGPPGVGKTLTAEGVAEDLKVPLYMVSVGELAMDSNRLEGMLQQIMDIAHSWGAVLLLDEADVFLEKRQTQDVHRNALVSIFLRLLEYFQGILFLTTNRVETFDEAFQSRIHVALKYDELSYQARKQVWRDFIDKVRVKEGLEVMPFKEDDYDWLAKKKLNGRQIKNSVRTAQALALQESKGLSMDHIKRVLDVHESFDRDLKGGTGYEDAMKSYL